MKKAALYILLFSYVMVMLKPVTPYISDLVAHTLYYSQHMATVHYENGKLHVHKEIVDNAKKDEPEKQTPASKKDNSGNEHISVLKTGELHHIKLTLKHTNPHSSSLTDIELLTDYPPPRI